MFNEINYEQSLEKNQLPDENASQDDKEPSGVAYLGTGSLPEPSYYKEESEEIQLLENSNNEEIFLSSLEEDLDNLDNLEKTEIEQNLLDEGFDTDSAANSEHLGFDSGQPNEEFILNYMEDPLREEDLEDEDKILDSEELIAEAEGEKPFENSTNMNEKLYKLSQAIDK